MWGSISPFFIFFIFFLTKIVLESIRDIGYVKNCISSKKGGDTREKGQLVVNTDERG